MQKCNRDCFHCVFPDCVQNGVTPIERMIQDYRDACVEVTGKIPKAHGSGKHNRGRGGGRYTSGAPYKM